MSSWSAPVEHFPTNNADFHWCWGSFRFGTNSKFWGCFCHYSFITTFIKTTIQYIYYIFRPKVEYNCKRSLEIGMKMFLRFAFWNTRNTFVVKCVFCLPFSLFRKKLVLCKSKIIIWLRKLSFILIEIWWSLRINQQRSLKIRIWILETRARNSYSPLSVFVFPVTNLETKFLLDW